LKAGKLFKVLKYKGFVQYSEIGILKYSEIGILNEEAALFQPKSLPFFTA